MEKYVKQVDEGVSLDFVPGYYQLFEESWRTSKEFYEDVVHKDYHFPSTTIQDFQTFFRFDFGDVILILLLAITWTILRWILTKLVFVPAIEWLDIAVAERPKAPESCWKFLFYGSTLTYNAYLLFFHGDYDFFHHPGRVWRGWSSDMHLGAGVYLYYMVQGSFYLHSIYATFFMDLWRKDSVAMIVHHLVTSTLIFMSYGFRYCNIGLLVFLLHDITDVELEFTKLNVYLKSRGKKYYPIHEYLSMAGFVSFALTWLVARLYWFPTRALYSAGVLGLGALHLPFSSLLAALLWFIYFLNVYWFNFIVVLLVKALTGEVKDLVDTREYDEGSKDSKKTGSQLNSNYELHKNKKKSQANSRRKGE